MRIVIAHNRYRQAGGEDEAVAAEAALLEAHGHSVTLYEVHNDAVAAMGRVALARATIWNSAQYQALRRLFQQVGPDVVHVHNTLPLISPAVYYAAKRGGAAVVQTLHNYRLICPSALLYRDGHPCELCVGSAFPWPGVLHACYRGDRAATSAVAGMLFVHRMRGTYEHWVDQYIALTEFARVKFIEGGLPDDRIQVKPNYVSCVDGVGTGAGGYALYVGRLSHEKGLGTLLESWRQREIEVPLRIIGDGPLLGEVQAASAGLARVTVLGRLPRERVTEEMKAAAMLVVPSTCYEGFPMTIVEAFAAGTPVIASNLGALAEIVDHRRTGLGVIPGDSVDLANAVRWMESHPALVHVMRREARLEYDRRFSESVAHAQLMDAYERAVSHASGGALQWRGI